MSLRLGGFQPLSSQVSEVTEPNGQSLKLLEIAYLAIKERMFEQLLFPPIGLLLQATHSVSFIAQGIKSPIEKFNLFFNQWHQS